MTSLETRGGQISLFDQFLPSHPEDAGTITREKYGSGFGQRPRTPGRRETMHMDNIYLERLLPLEEYDTIIVLFSGGKDSLACALDLLERGVPREKIEMWHHDIDGGHPTRRMDWPVTQAYVRSVAKHLGITLRVSWRVNGFYGEVYRLGASWPIQYIDCATGEQRECRLSDRQIRSVELRAKILDAAGQAELEQMGRRMKYPAKSPSLATRWCSSVLKIDVADTVIRNLELDELKALGYRMKYPAKSGCHQGRWCSGSLKAQVEGKLYADIDELARDAKILVISGERREESPGRAKYNEMEIHRTNATAKAHRLVHQWRSVIDWPEEKVWEIIERHNIAPHPCYTAGWNRCSCMMCIFSLPSHWAGIRELFPKCFAEVEEDERVLGHTLNIQINKNWAGVDKSEKYIPMPLAEYVGDAPSCVCYDDPKAIHQLITGEFDVADVKMINWTLPAGAFHGAAGGPC